MNSKTLIAIAVVALGLLGVALWVTSSSEQAFSPAAAPTGEKAELFPGLLDKVNDVTKVEIESGADKVTLNKHEDYWGLEQSNGYRINFKTLGDLIRNIAMMEKVEEKTSNSAYYERLEVADIGEDSTSKKVTLYGPSDAELASLILGKAEYQGFESAHQYVRLAGKDQVWLVSGNAAAQTTATQWLDKEVLNIANTEPRRVVISHRDGEELVGSRNTSTDSAFELQDIPEGMELKSPTITGEFGRMLTGVRFDKVQPKSDVTLNNDDRTTSLTLETFDGLTIQADIYETDGQKYVTFLASVNEQAITDENQRRTEEAAKASTPEPTEDEETKEDEEATEPTPTPVAPELIDVDAIRAKADDINKRIGEWAYQFPSYLTDRFTRRIDYYVAAPPEPEEETTSNGIPNLDGVPMPESVKKMLNP